MLVLCIYDDGETRWALLASLLLLLLISLQKRQCKLLWAEHNNKTQPLSKLGIIEWQRRGYRTGGMERAENCPEDNCCSTGYWHFCTQRDGWPFFVWRSQNTAMDRCMRLSRNWVLSNGFFAHRMHDNLFLEMHCSEGGTIVHKYRSVDERCSNDEFFPVWEERFELSSLQKIALRGNTKIRT